MKGLVRGWCQWAFFHYFCADYAQNFIFLLHYAQMFILGESLWPNLIKSPGRTLQQASISFGAKKQVLITICRSLLTRNLRKLASAYCLSLTNDTLGDGPPREPGETSDEWTLNEIIINFSAKAIKKANETSSFFDFASSRLLRSIKIIICCVYLSSFVAVRSQVDGEPFPFLFLTFSVKLTFSTTVCSHTGPESRENIN